MEALHHAGRRGACNRARRVSPGWVTDPALVYHTFGQCGASSHGFLRTVGLSRALTPGIRLQAHKALRIWTTRRLY